MCFALCVSQYFQSTQTKYMIHVSSKLLDSIHVFYKLVCLFMKKQKKHTSNITPKMYLL